MFVFNFLIEVQLIYNIVLVSGVHKSDSAIYIYILLYIIYILVFIIYVFCLRFFCLLDCYKILSIVPDAIQ